MHNSHFCKNPMQFCGMMFLPLVIYVLSSQSQIKFLNIIGTYCHDYADPKHLGVRKCFLFLHSWGTVLCLFHVRTMLKLPTNLAIVPHECRGNFTNKHSLCSQEP